jgi:hypothetical protein
MTPATQRVLASSSSISVTVIRHAPAPPNDHDQRAR